LTPRPGRGTVGPCLTAQASHHGPAIPNQRAKLIVELATGQAEDKDPNEVKNPAAVALRRLGAKGGPARAKKLAPAKRADIAKKAAKARCLAN